MWLAFVAPIIFVLDSTDLEYSTDTVIPILPRNKPAQRLSGLTKDTS